MPNANTTTHRPPAPAGRQRRSPIKATTPASKQARDRLGMSAAPATVPPALWAEFVAAMQHVDALAAAQPKAKSGRPRGPNIHVESRRDRGA